MSSVANLCLGAITAAIIFASVGVLVGGVGLLIWQAI
jgi:hypothetical protein